MKTAMQELIEILTKEIKDNPFINLDTTMFIPSLEKEKEQIADAFRNGSTSSMLGGGHWTQYYNQTYNQED